MSSSSMGNPAKGGGKPYGQALLLILIWGSFAAVSRLALTSLDVFQMQFYLFGAAFLALFAWAAAGKRLSCLKGIGPRGWGWLLLLGALSFLYYFLYSFSLSLIDPVDASCINYMFPVWITLLAVPINGERMTAGKAVSAALGFIGMVVIVTGGDLTRLRLDNLPGLLCAAAASLSWALFSTLGKRGAVEIVAGNFVFAGVGFFLSCVLLVLFSRFAAPPLPALGAILWNGIMNFGVNYFLWFRLLKSSSASFAASMSFITPFVTLAFLAVFAGGEVTWANVLGLAVILAGVAVQNASSGPSGFWGFRGRKSRRKTARREGP